MALVCANETRGLGFVVAIIAAWLYNLAAGFVGGIEIELK